MVAAIWMFGSIILATMVPFYYVPFCIMSAWFAGREFMRG